MLSALASLTLMSSTQGQQSAVPALKRIVPVTTGANGYEEYIAACLVVADKSLVLEFPKTSPVPHAVNPEPRLQLIRNILAQNGKVLDLVRVGNTKPAFRPDEGSFEMATTFPELRYFRDIARIGCLASEEKLRAGAAAGSWDDLIVTLEFAGNIADTGLLISYLVGMVCTDYVLRAVEERDSLIPEAQAAKLAQVCARLLEKSPILHAAHTEYVTVVRELEKPGVITDEALEELGIEPGSAKANEFRASLTPYLAVLRDMAGRCEAVSREPESSWGDFLNEASERSIASGLAGATLAPAVGRIPRRDAQYRAQLRLLRLTAALSQYRWRYGQFPDALDDLGTGVSEHSGSKTVFRYQRLGARFDLVAIVDGRAIRLTDRQPSGPQNEGAPPPFASFFSSRLGH